MAAGEGRQVTAALIGAGGAVLAALIAGFLSGRVTAPPGPSPTVTATETVTETETVTTSMPTITLTDDPPDSPNEDVPAPTDAAVLRQDGPLAFENRWLDLDAIDAPDWASNSELQSGSDVELGNAGYQLRAASDASSANEDQEAVEIAEVDELSKDACVAATNYGERIVVNEAAAGQLYCLKTSEGGYATLELTTWQDPEFTIYRWA